MIVLLTGGSSTFALTIASRLRRDGHEVRLTDRVSATSDIIPCELEADDGTAALVEGVGHIIHVEPSLDLPLEADAWLDICTRCTYNLLMAAAKARVDRVTVLGSMAIFDPYDLSHGVLPEWEPRPSTEPAVFGPHMAEFCAREFALLGAVRVLVARLGDLHATEAEAIAANARWWIAPDEAADVLAQQLAVDLEASPGTSGYDLFSRNTWARINLARGGLSAASAASDAWWMAANGGLSSWVPPPCTPPAQTPKPRPSSNATPRLLLLGGSGMFGPDIITSIEKHGGYDLRITDIIDRPALRDEAQVMRWETKNETTTAAAPAQLDMADGQQGEHEWRSVDISNAAEVLAAAEGTDLTMVLSVVRTHPVTAFKVNSQGVYNACKAAVYHGHERLINTGPWSVVGGHSKTFNHRVTEEMPAHSGLDLYSFTKGLGHEISRVFSANYPLHVLCTLHGSFPINDGSGRFEHGSVKETDEEGKWAQGSGLVQPFCATFAESAECIRSCVTVDLARMPSRCEAFFVVGSFPDAVYSNAKAKRLLDWEPSDDLSQFYTRTIPVAKL